MSEANISVDGIVICAVALLYQHNYKNHQKVMAALIVRDPDDTTETLKRKAEDYHKDRLGDDLNDFAVVAFEVATPNYK